MLTIAVALGGHFDWVCVVTRLQLFKRDATLLSENGNASENMTEKLTLHSFKLILAIIPTC